MAIYKDDKTWTVQCRIKNRDGTTKQHKKRGFLTKKEAKEYESKITSKISKCHMKLSEFYEIYLTDKKNELKYRTILTKRQMIETHILPYFGELPLDEITAQDIQNWQNEMYEKDYEPTYLRSIANQLSGMLNHACNIYEMPTSPYRKVKKMGKSDANRIDFWTFEEYQRFIRAMKDDPVYFPLFETLYYTGMREGDDDDKIRLNQRKPSKYKGLRRFGPEKNLQRINKFMKERPIFYKNLIQMKENIRFYLRCFYCITKVMILQFNSENRTELARNG